MKISFIPAGFPREKVIHWFYLYLLPAFAFFFYLMGAPHSVQGGDTGELVASAWNYLLPHAPGFPVFSGSLALFLRIVPVGSVFFRASLFSILSACLTLHLLLRALQRRKLFALSFVLLLASQFQFWRFALLPDLFLFHFLLTSLFLYSFLFVKKGSMKGKTMLFAVGLGTHFLSLFAFPIWMMSLRRKTTKQIVLHFGFLIFFLAVSYGSLVFWKNSDLSSWGFNSTILGFIGYLFRTDYGAFQLTSRESSGAWLANFWCFCLATKNFLFLFCFVFALNPNVYRRNLWKIFVFSLLVFLSLFFYLAKLNPIGFAGEVISRFYLFPLSLIVWILVIMIQELSQEKYVKLKFVFTFGIFFLAVSQWIEGRDDNFFSKRVVIEEYAKNLLSISSGSTQECRVLLVDSDTLYGATRYLQTVEGVAKNSIIINMGLTGLPWYQDKIRFSGLVWRTKDQGTADLYSSFLKPNLEKCRVFADSWRNWQSLKVLLLSIGAELKLGEGLEFTARSQIFTTASPKPTRKYDLEKKIYARYADRAFLEGRSLEVKGKFKEAAQLYEEGIALAPWCLRLKSLLCEMREKSNQAGLDDCEAGLSDLSQDFYCPE